MFHRFSNWISHKFEDNTSEEHIIRQFDALTSLKQALLAIIAENATRKDKFNDPFTENDDEVHQLCYSIQNCLDLGLQTALSWWHIVSSSSLILNDPALTQSAETAALVSSTLEGKAICWLKIVLNNHTLEHDLNHIFSSPCEQLIHASYENYSLVRSTQGLEIFLHMISELSEVRFMIQVNEFPFKSMEYAVGEEYWKSELALSENMEDTTESSLIAQETDKVSLDLQTAEIEHSHRVFGVSLDFTCHNSRYTRFACIDQALAVPNIVQDCVDILSANPNTARLFRTTVVNIRIHQLREYVETHNALPPDITVHESGALLLDYFKNLPESLLTTEKYEAFIAAGHLKETSASVRNIACLIEDLPIQSKIVLEKIVTLLHFLQLPQHSLNNGLEIGMAAAIFAPVIAFKGALSVQKLVSLPSAGGDAVGNLDAAGSNTTTPSSSPLKGAIMFRRTSMSQDVRFAAIGAQVVERMIQYHDQIFPNIRKAIAVSLKRFQAKERALFKVYTTYKTSVSDSDKQVRQMLNRISFAMLHNAGKAKHDKTQIEIHDRFPRTLSHSSALTTYASLATESELMDLRHTTLIHVWQLHGFHGSNIADNFVLGGVLMLQCLYYITESYDHWIDRLYYHAQLGLERKRYDICQLMSRICTSLLRLLKLIPKNKVIDAVALSHEPFYSIFEENNYFQLLFSIFLQLFDRCYSHSIDANDTDPNLFNRIFQFSESEIEKNLSVSPLSIKNIRLRCEQSFEMPAEEIDANENEMIETPASPDELCMAGKLMQPSSILTLAQISQIQNVLPATIQICDWYLLYSTELHGSSLDTLLMMSRKQHPSLLVIRDESGNVFGGFASDEWHRGSQYYGNGETFLFSFQQKNEKSLVKYGWSRRNDYFMLCSENSLSMGGGGSFGLFLDNDLSSGSTGACETFDSLPLVKSGVFECVQLEVWAFTCDGREMRHEVLRKSVLD